MISHLAAEQRKKIQNELWLCRQAKAVYCFRLCIVENYFHQQNNDNKIKINEDL